MPVGEVVGTDRFGGSGGPNITLADEETVPVSADEVVGTDRFGGSGGPNITLADEDPVPVLVGEVVGTKGFCRGKGGTLLVGSTCWR